jgi:hypothetical protein
MLTVYSIPVSSRQIKNLLTQSVENDIVATKRLVSSNKRRGYIMYHRRSNLCLIVSFLLLNLSIFTSCNDNAGAQGGGQPVTAKEFVPAVGFVFDSRKDDGSGDFETGAFTIEKFLLEDGNLMAKGVLKGATISPSGTELTLPVNIIASTCNVLELDIGPPDGLMDPIDVVAYRPSTNLSPSDFCKISEANASGDNNALVDLMNQEGTAQLRSGCPWYLALGCAPAITVCGILCGAVGRNSPTCRLCFSQLDAGECINCL